jgi:hypothetical protein
MGMLKWSVKIDLGMGMLNLSVKIDLGMGMLNLNGFGKECLTNGWV